MSIRVGEYTSTPAAAVERVAREQDVSLIVIGSHGRSAVEDVLLGSVSDAVICRHTKPVLVVRPVRIAMPVYGGVNAQARGI